MTNRKQFMVDRALQYRLGAETMVIVTLMLAVPFAFFATFLAENPGVPVLRSEGLLVGLFRYHWPSMGLFYVLYAGIVFVFVAHYSHRIAGPVHRLRRVLDDMAEGRMAQHVRLRKGDYFENLGVSVGRVAEGLTANLSELRTVASALSELATQRTDRELGAQVAKVQRILDRYTVAPKG